LELENSVFYDKKSNKSSRNDVSLIEGFGMMEEKKMPRLTETVQSAG